MNDLLDRFLDWLEALRDRVDPARLAATLCGGAVVAGLILAGAGWALGRKAEESALESARRWFGGGLEWETFRRDVRMGAYFTDVRAWMKGNNRTPYFEAERLTARAYAGDLLRGNARAAVVEMTRPRLRLTLNQDGVLDFGGLRERFARCGPKPGFADFPRRIVIREGTVELRMERGEEGASLLTLENANGELGPSRDGKAFGFRLNGKAIGTTWTAEGRFSPCDDDQFAAKGSAPAMDLDLGRETLQRALGLAFAKDAWLPGGPAEVSFQALGPYDFIETTGRFSARDLDAEFVWTRHSLALNSIRAGIGTLKGSGQATVELGEEGVPLSAKIELKSVPLEKLKRGPFARMGGLRGLLSGTLQFQGRLTEGRPALRYGAFLVQNAVLPVPDPIPQVRMNELTWRPEKAEMKFDRISGSLMVGRNEARIGSLKIRGKGFAAEGELALRPLSGGDPASVFQEEFAYKGELNVEADDAGALTGAFRALGRPFSGKTSGAVKFEGDTADASKFRAWGSVEIAEGKAENPYLFDAMGPRLRTKEFSSLSFDFDADAVRFLVDDLAFTSESLSFRGSGRAGYDGILEGHGRAALSVDEAMNALSWRAAAFWLYNAPEDSVVEGPFELKGTTFRPVFWMGNPELRRPKPREEEKKEKEEQEGGVSGIDGEPETAPAEGGPDAESGPAPTGEDAEGVSHQDEKIIKELESILEEYQR